MKTLLSQEELAHRWGKSESTVSWACAVGVGPSYVKVDGKVMYPVEEVQKYERACLFFNPADVAFQTS
jgi:hypothetical protein